MNTAAIIWRLVLSLIAMASTGFVSVALRAYQPVLVGNTAVGQFENSDAAWVKSSVILHYATSPMSLSFFTFLFLVLIWYSPIKNLLRPNGDGEPKASQCKCNGTCEENEDFTFQDGIKAIIVFALIGSLALGNAAPAYAYYDVKDRPEYVEVQPNQSAFLIPLVGANKTGQKQFMSEAYLVENKVAAKRIQIPHTLIESGVVTERNKYVPAAKLIVVDRTPYNREWVKSQAKGTAGADQSIVFESSESVEGYTGISISAFVKEENAAKFLYYFGTSTTVNPADPNSNFASVANGKSLAEVMDNNVRMKVQSILAQEFGKRTTIEGIKQKAEIIALCETELKTTFEAKGITIDFIGFAEGLTFSKEVQNSLDQIFVSSLDAQTLPTRLKVLELRKGEAEINLKNATGTAMQKWNGQLPFWFPSEIWNKILAFFHMGPAGGK